MRTAQEIEDFIDGIVFDINILDYIDIENINQDDAFESIKELLEENGAFNQDIIYYSTAMEYLSENDPSLTNSLNIATEFGFSIENLTSEVLASLLYQSLLREEFDELENEINEFFEK